MSNVATVGAENFEAEVVRATQPVVVDFWAEWCPPCRALSPVLDHVATQFADKIKVVKCNVDENDELASKYGALRIPNLIFFKNGQVVDQTVGFLNETDLTKKFQEVLA